MGFVLLQIHTTVVVVVVVVFSFLFCGRFCVFIFENAFVSWMWRGGLLGLEVLVLALFGLSDGNDLFSFFGLIVIIIIVVVVVIARYLLLHFCFLD
jgi:hypothetical protein